MTTTHTRHQHLQHLRHERHKDAVELKHDQRDLHHARNHVAHTHDKLVDDKKDLARARKAVGNLRDREHERLAPLVQRKAELQRQYDATVDPTTGAGDPALAAQLQTAQEAIDGVHARLDPRISDKTGARDHLKAAVDRERQAIARDHRVIAHKKKEIAHDKSALRKDDKAIQKAMSVPNVVGGQVGRWIAEAQTILRDHGVPLSKMNARDLAMIIQHESGGNPRAVNNWDSNAAAGHPSKGLMQTIGPTFDAYKLHGHGHILNPVDNIIAGTRYAISRYGSISNVPGVRAVHAGGAYVGY